MTIEQEYLPRQTTLIENIKLLCYLIKDKGKKPCLKEEEVTRKKKLADVARNVEKATVEVTQWTFAVLEKRLDFKQFQRNVEIDWKAAELAKKNIEENSKEVLRAESAKFSSAMSAVNLQSKTRKKSMQTEMQLLDSRLKSINEIRCWRKNDLYNAR
ncbi:hypothetical protein WH47_09163 [Habropoda laboriosa]|uniref:Uncharacterized protein n=2 Tax=Habropoda laboriosa TaxID=597456 RepID=A0A0L7QMV4_9HYME|nr:hypothetical protein WH47_09163 [Habropoda laboriosa]